ncbi:hypothetical protein TVAG_463500 [Trichomonas vaginalis G3]|uniref:Kelch motif family protein n=1 Tax=Trichomonas vaginalis (strain ATCC PRA-98 / G3) TaxID=412133 RepID=A2EH22_TRIV3|nr:galactose oxidase, central domain-containing protein [Trichomonas vaginalis G3]EAY08070.1 hypothetical protein TVAG_463500 [Trichomonas vaginalis G3]KAI5543013.1 galactose oxidase, central domain-containing protein [Trichomonas vaginalis G3]|eukprot:XP_001320293.1 hypothetical protein [Trichomonas vaginalis G3]
MEIPSKFVKQYDISLSTRFYQIAGYCVSNRGKLHIFGGYDFFGYITQIHDRKQLEQLEGRYLCFEIVQGKPKTKVDTVPSSRFIGSSCAYIPEFETGVLFSGFCEDFSQDSSQDSFQYAENTGYYGKYLINYKFNGKLCKDNIEKYCMDAYKPASRAFHAVAWDSDRCCLWVYSGTRNISSNKSECMPELWKWCAITNKWTLIPTDSPKSRYGHAMVYYKDRLYIFGGSVNRTTPCKKVVDIIDFSKNRIPKWERINLEKSHMPYGATMNVVNIDGVGTRIIISGGQLEDMSESLTNNQNISIADDETEFKDLEITILNPEDNKSTKAIIKGVNNVAYHSSAVMNGKLYLNFGFNQAKSGAISYSPKIIEIDISGAILSMFNPEINRLEPYFSPEKPYNEEIKPVVQLTSLKTQISQFWRSMKQTPLVDIFFQHQTNPSPISDFIVFTGEVMQNPRNSLIKFSAVYIMKQVMTRRIGKFMNKLYDLSLNHIYDFALYSYTGTIIPERSIYTNFQDFKLFFELCLEFKYYRLIWLEVGCHISDLKPSQIIEICATRDPNTHKAAMENPQLYILFYIFNETLRVNFDAMTTAELESIQNLPLVAEYMTDFIGMSPNVKPVEFKFIIPETNALRDLSDLFPDTIMQINGTLAAYLGDSIMLGDTNITDEFSTSVIDSVIKCDMKMIIDRSNDEETIKKIIQSIQLINLLKKVTVHFISSYYSPHMSTIRRLVLKSGKIHSAIIEMIPKIKHELLFAFLVHVLGIGGEFEFFTKDLVSIICRSSSLRRLVAGNRYAVNTTAKMMYPILALMYMGEDNCKIENLPKFVNKDDLGGAILDAASQKPCIVPSFVLEKAKPLVLNYLKQNKGDHSSSFIVKHFCGAVQIGVLEDMIANHPTNEWVSRLEQEKRREMDGKELKALFIHTFSSKYSK